MRAKCPHCHMMVRVLRNGAFTNHGRLVDGRKDPCKGSRQAAFMALERAVNDFAEAMKARLRAKAKEGFTGWDCDALGQHDVPNRLLGKAAKVYALTSTCTDHYAVRSIGMNTLVDIANFAMILWYRARKILSKED